MKTIITGLGLMLLPMAGLNAQLLFDFFAESNASNSSENTGVAVSGSVVVDTTLGTVKITINNLAGTAKPGGGNYGPGDIVAFGFHDSPDSSGANSLIFGLTSDTTGEDWSAVDPFTAMWAAGQPYYGAEADNKGDAPGNTSSDAIADGEMGVMFTFTTADTAGLANVAAYWTANDSEDWSTPAADMLFRFQSTNGAGSDKIAVNLVEVPEPSTYGLFGAGALAALIAIRRFRRK